YTMACSAQEGGWGFADLPSGDGSLSSPYVVGNPDLKPERSRGWDLGLETDFQGRNGFAALNLGERHIRDMIAKETRLESDGFYYNRAYNVAGTSIVRTIELDGRLDLRALGLRHVALMGNYTRFFSRKAGSSAPLSDQPHYVVNTGMDWRIPAWKTLLGWRYNYQGRIVKNGGETESALHLLDVFAYWDIDRTWSLRVSGANLLDARKTKQKETYDSAGRLTARTREQEAGGRSLLVTLEARL
uniref:TonB-dependent receptor n=1 Tax=Caldimonas sp. TaxID=2838790 RepID=UPI00307F7130